MAIIAVVGRKGGVGKSTIAGNLAAEFAAMGRSVIVLDADPQHSLAAWASQGQGMLSHCVEKVKAADADTLRAPARAAEKDVDLAIIDTPPGMPEITYQAALVADLLLLPCGPSPLDLFSLKEAEIASRAGAATPRGFVPQSSELAGRAIALPVPSGSRNAATSWLVAVPESDSVADFERFLAHHAVMVVALAQMRERVVAETERRLAGDVLGLVLSGRIDGEEIVTRLAPFAISDEAAVLVLGVEDPDALADELARVLAD